MSIVVGHDVEETWKVLDRKAAANPDFRADLLRRNPSLRRDEFHRD
jgi:hypothetical protein